MTTPQKSPQNPQHSPSPNPGNGDTSLEGSADTDPSTIVVGADNPLYRPTNDNNN